MKFTEIPECWKLTVMYKVNGLSRSINVKYKTKELAAKEMCKQWKEFIKKYNVQVDRDYRSVCGTFFEYHKGNIIYMSDLQQIDVEHIYEEPIDIAAPCGSLVQPMGHPDVTLQLATPLIKGECFSSRVLEGEMPKDVKGWVVLSDTEEKEKRKELGEL